MAKVDPLTCALDVKARDLLGAPGCSSIFLQPNLAQDLTTGRSVTSILHLVNSTPVNWFCKPQGSVATTTYSSGFVADRLGIKQIMDMRYTFCSLRAPSGGRACMFSDNAGVITNWNIPDSSLIKRHNVLSYHCVLSQLSSGSSIFLVRLTLLMFLQNSVDMLSSGL